MLCKYTTLRTRVDLDPAKIPQRLEDDELVSAAEVERLMGMRPLSLGQWLDYNSARVAWDEQPMHSLLVTRWRLAPALATLGEPHPGKGIQLYWRDVMVKWLSLHVTAWAASIKR